jgi:hypothetical protein
MIRKLDHHQVNYKKKAVRMMFTMIVTFLICRLPFTALILYRDKSQSNLAQSNHVQNLVSIDHHTDKYSCTVFFTGQWYLSQSLVYF